MPNACINMCRKKKLLFQVLERLPVVLLVSTANNEAATEQPGVIASS